ADRYQGVAKLFFHEVGSFVKVVFDQAGKPNQKIVSLIAYPEGQSRRRHGGHRYVTGQSGLIRGTLFAKESAPAGAQEMRIDQPGGLYLCLLPSIPRPEPRIHSAPI